MRNNFLKPTVFSSKCLGFAACRWNGVSIQDEFVDILKPYTDFITACPECEIGLGIPRNPIRIVSGKGPLRLLQLDTERDITEEMNDFTDRFLTSLERVDGFILKDRSPSCGIKDVKIYAGLKATNIIRKGAGFFGKEVLKRFPGVPIETEARLSNFTIREHFLTRLFVFTKFNRIKQKFLMKALVQFHAENKFLLMAYSQRELKVMGNIVANRENKNHKDIFAEYQSHLHKALEESPDFKAVINVLMHALGYFSKGLTPEERRFFLNTLEEYRREQIPLSVPAGILRSYIVRFGEGYLRQQTFFEPYPRELAEIKDSGQGRSHR